MKVKQLRISCPCNGEVKNNITIGLTVNKDLVVIGKCNDCSDTVTSLIALEKLMIMCPTEEKGNGHS